MNGISVIVCCCNSALRLPLTLQHLSKQKIDEDLSWEVIVVDNNSNDGTAEIALKHWLSLSCDKNLKVIYENKVGLSFAREAGVKAAFYDIIIFCDDDNLLAENYLLHGYNLIQRTKDLGYGIWGGKSTAYFDVDVTVPEWFEIKKANYVVGQQADRAGDITKRGYVWGAGMIILKKLFLQVSNEQLPLLLMDRKGSILLSGGDSEICLRSQILGYKLYYDDHLKFKHYIPFSRLTLQYNTGLEKGFAQAHMILNKYSIFIYYVSARNFPSRTYYSFVFIVKFILAKLGLRILTNLDTTSMSALFSNKYFHDVDFDSMRYLLKQRKLVKLS